MNNEYDQVIAVSLWDHNSFKSDEFMGYSFIAFDDCYKDKPTSKVYSSRVLAAVQVQIFLYHQVFTHCSYELFLSSHKILVLLPLILTRSFN